MKIRITEAQLSMIKTLREDANNIESSFEVYNKFCMEKSKELDTIYTKLINEPIGSVLNNEINLSEVDNMVSNINDQIYSAHKKISNMLELIWDDEDDTVYLTYDNKIWNIYDSASKKSNALEMIISALKKLQDEDDEEKIKEPFKNIKPIEVQSFGPDNFEP